MSQEDSVELDIIEQKEQNTEKKSFAQKLKDKINNTQKSQNKDKQISSDAISQSINKLAKKNKNVIDFSQLEENQPDYEENEDQNEISLSLEDENSKKIQNNNNKKMDESQDKDDENYKDIDNFLKGLSDDEDNQELLIKNKPKKIEETKVQGKVLDPNRFEIYEDYQAMLNLTDISYGQKGHNKFYEIKITHKRKNEFRVCYHWGRVGGKGQQRFQEHDSKYSAIIEFKDKFYDKTRNNWENRANFKPISGKYTLLKMENTKKNQGSLNDQILNLNKRNQLIKTRIQNNKSNLDQKVGEFLKNIWDIEKINTALQQMNFDTVKNPLGKLTLDQINKGYKILNEISKILKKTKINKQLLIELTNQFYTNIPQSYGMQRPPEIDNLQRLREKIHLLDVLKEIDITNKFILKISAKEQSINPLDAFYEMLQIQLIQIPQNNIISEQIQNTIKTSHGTTHDTYTLQVTDIFEIQRKGEKQRFNPFQQLNNKMMLWHGSRTTNYVGILSEGLRIAPPDAPVTGYMFGKGIYFSDVPSKAANYCHASINNTEGILILCEVALGTTHEVYRSEKFVKPPIYYHSVKGVGKKILDPNGQNYQMGHDQQFILNNGKVIDNQSLLEDGIKSDLMYNEYVVYDVAQVQMKYLVKVKFNYI